MAAVGLWGSKGSVAELCRNVADSDGRAMEHLSEDLTQAGALEASPDRAEVPSQHPLMHFAYFSARIM